MAVQRELYKNQDTLATPGSKVIRTLNEAIRTLTLVSIYFGLFARTEAVNKF